MSVASLSRRRLPWGLFVLLIWLDVATRVLEKIAVANSAAAAQTAFALSLLTQPGWWLGLALGPLQLWVWTRILACTELNIAYPLSSLSYPLTMVTAWCMFGEYLSPRVWFGAGLMTVGAAIIGSATERPRDVNSMQQATGTLATHVTGTSNLSNTETSVLQPIR